MNAPIHASATEVTHHASTLAESPVHRPARHKVQQDVVPATHAREEDADPASERADAIGAALMILGIAGMMLLWVSSR